MSNIGADVFAEWGVMYQSMLFPCLFFCLLVMGGLCRVYKYLHLSSAFWYGGAA